MSKTEKLSHIGILLIGISALVVSVWQVKLAQHHNKLSVRPYLRFTLSNSIEGEEDFMHRLSISNSGQGPAIIKSFEYEVDGQKADRFVDAIALAGLSGDIGPYFTTTHDPGDVIEEKTTAVLFAIDDVSRKNKTIRITVKYMSMYDEEFEVVTNY